MASPSGDDESWVVLGRVLHRIRELVRAGRYVITLHAYEEMTDDDLSVEDIEHAILTGAIVERQVDRVTNESKYVIQGSSRSSEDLVVVAKIGPTMRVVVITVYLGGAGDDV